MFACSTATMPAHPLSREMHPAVRTLLSFFLVAPPLDVLPKSPLCVEFFPATGPLFMLLYMVIQGPGRDDQKTALAHLIAMNLPEVDAESILLVLLLTFIACACWMC